MPLPAPLPGPGDPKVGSPGPRTWMAVLAIACVALFLRAAMIEVVGDATGFRAATKASGSLVWEWGYEQAAISSSVAAGNGFADPFLKGSGPTAWAAPLYPALVGALLWATGGPTWTAALTLALLQALSAALVAVFLFRLGRALHSERLGLLAAALWALHPMAAYLPVTLVWDSTFVALGLTWFLACLAEMRRPPGSAPTDQVQAPRAAGLGARFGVLLLVNPAPLALLPMVAWEFLRGPRPPRAARNLGVFLLTAAAVTAPWTMRNAGLLGSPNIRTNLGVEFFVGNNDGAQGSFNGALHPAYNDAEFARYLDLGEVAYSADCRARALAWATASPTKALALTATRVQRFWLGPTPSRTVVVGGVERPVDWQGQIKRATHGLVGLLGILGALFWRSPKRGSGWIPRGVMLLFPAVYYLTHVLERYRFPMEPVVTLLAAAFLLRLLQARSDSTH